jgi:hypothetical protein
VLSFSFAAQLDSTNRPSGKLIEIGAVSETRRTIAVADSSSNQDHSYAMPTVKKHDWVT